MPKPKDTVHDERADTSEKLLARVERESETIAGSSTRRAAHQGASDKAQGWLDHFSGKDALGEGEGGTTDPAELWGRRIGRALSALGVIVLGYWLGQTLMFW